MNRIILSLLILSFFAQCQGKKTEKALPILGNSYTEEIIVNGKKVIDTIYHTIPEFTFLNQYGEEVSRKDMTGSIYIADFFFTSCPTICPIMKTQMLRVYEVIQDMEDVKILSHSIDPEHDTVELLYDFADRLGVEGRKWQFLTGDKKKIFEVAQKGYIVTAVEDSKEPGGYIHSGAFMLIDKKGRVRGAYDGTKAEDVDRLIRDLPKLRSEG